MWPINNNTNNNNNSTDNTDNSNFSHQFPSRTVSLAEKVMNTINKRDSEGLTQLHRAA